MGLLDAKGNPISSASFKKAPSPQLGEKYAPLWMGDRDRTFLTLPGGGTVMFDLSRLQLADFRAMRDHYQINATLAVMTFMIHQMDWRVECDNKKIADFVTENLYNVWTPFVRAISQSFWAGYSPNVLQWDNDLEEKRVVLTKVKDVIPEEACVNWKDVPGWAPEGHIPPKIKVYDGIKIFGQHWPVPTENSFWYPLMMENGDMYGRKLLRPVFTSWYFSLLIHLFSNRYFERFGEPVPVGRAPYEDEIDVNGNRVRGSDLMVQILQNLRNRSVVVLPNDRTPTGAGTASEFDYEIEYLESQMRGADFERYLMRLDEEMSIGLFTPLLTLRTADVGSYNLGVTHWNVYLNMLNAIVGDLKSYADPYILNRMVDFNFGTKAPRAKLIFRKMGDDKVELVKELLKQLVTKGTAKPDLNQLGDIVGLTVTEVKEVLDGPQSKPDDTGKNDSPSKDSGGKGGGKGSSNSQAAIEGICRRVGLQLAEHVGAGVAIGSFSAAFGDSSQLNLSENLYREMCDSAETYIRELGPLQLFGISSESAFQIVRSAMMNRYEALVTEDAN